MNNIDHHDDELKYRPFSRLSRHKKKNTVASSCSQRHLGATPRGTNAEVTWQRARSQACQAYHPIKSIKFGTWLPASSSPKVSKQNQPE
jgi:hypothetical protein